MFKDNQFTIDQLTIVGVSRKQFNTQHSKLKNAKSVIERLYDEQGNEAEVWYFKSPSMIYDILNKQVEILTTQCIGTCKSAYTKGLCPKLSTNK